ncbi:response regulator transcription factor [Knoellia locipacati]
MLTRAGIVRLLTEAGHEVVGEAGDATELLRHVAQQGPDAVIVDIRMPPTHTDEGLVAAQQIVDRHPSVAVLVLSQYVDPAYALRLLEERPERVGYLLKERVFDVVVLVDALRRLHDGESVVDPSIVSRLMRRPRADDPVDRLSAREQEILACVAEGLSNHGIAARLYIAERTVEAHITRAFQKLGLVDAADAHRRVLATLLYLRSDSEPTSPTPATDSLRSPPPDD